MAETIAAADGVKVRIRVAARFGSQPPGSLDLSQCVAENNAEFDSVSLNAKLSWVSEWIVLAAGGTATVVTPFKKITGMHIISKGFDSEANVGVLAWAPNATAGSYDIIVHEHNGTSATAVANAKKVRIVVTANMADQISAA